MPSKTVAKPVAKPAPPLVAHCLELFEPLQGAAPDQTLRARGMFGGHGFHMGPMIFAFIAQDQLYLKVNAATQPKFEAAGGQPFVYTYPGSGKTIQMPYFTVPVDAMESPAFMAPWGRLALQAAVAAYKPQRPKASNGPEQAKEARASKPRKKPP